MPDDLSKIDLEAHMMQNGGRSRSILALGISRLIRDRVSFFSCIILIAFVCISIAAPLLAPYDPIDTDFSNRMARPNAQHWLGTDELGRDILSRIIVGSRISLFMGFAAVAIGLGVGVALGIVAGYIRQFDNPIMRIMDVLLAFPGFLVAIGVVAALGPGITNAVIAVGVHSIPQFVRITRSAVLSIREREFVEGAKALGSSNLRVMTKHILPNLIGPVMVFGTLRLSTAILVLSGLSFLGLGAQAPTAEWGAMASRGRLYLTTDPHLVLFPALAIFVVVLLFNFIGDGIRDAFDTRLW